MDYTKNMPYLIYWDTINSSSAAQSNYADLIAFLDHVGIIAMRIADQFDCSLVTNIGDGQVFAANQYEQGVRFAKELIQQSEELGYKIAIVIGQDTLTETSIGPQAKLFWQFKDLSHQYTDTNPIVHTPTLVNT